MPEKPHWSSLKDGMCESSAECRLTPDEIEFGQAMSDYKRLRCRPHPTWHEVLAVALSLGYRKVAKRTYHLPKFEP